MLNYLLAQVETLVNEPFMQTLSLEDLASLMTERTNLNVKVNSLRMSCLLSLEEISFYCEQVFEKLDDWVVVSVKRDNMCCQKIVKNFKAEIDKQTSYLDCPEVTSADLSRYIETIKFKVGPPKYMLKVPDSSRSCFEGRFEASNLGEIYKMFKHNGFEELLDKHTFLSLML
jgi:hypothetical protein